MLFAFHHRNDTISSMMGTQANKSKPFWGSLFFIITIVVILLSLSLWQVQRLGWKNSLINNLNDREAVLEAPNLKAWDVSLTKPAPVLFFGHYIPEYSVLVRNNDKVIVYMPFRTTDGVYVMVRRGIADHEQITGKALAQITNPGTISIIGIPTPLPRNVPMISTQRPDGLMWDYLDWDAIKSRFKSQPFAPYILTVLEEPDLGLELDRTLPEIRNEHRNYAIFWFVMAVLAGSLLTRFLLLPKSGE